MYGIASGGTRLRIRNSAGSMPSARAARSTERSRAKFIGGLPTPRFCTTGALLVTMLVSSMLEAGIVYGPTTVANLISP